MDVSTRDIGEIPSDLYVRIRREWMKWHECSVEELELEAQQLLWSAYVCDECDAIKGMNLCLGLLGALETVLGEERLEAALAPLTRGHLRDRYFGRRPLSVPASYDRLDDVAD